MGEEIRLPEVKCKSSTCIEEAIVKRRSIRDFSDEKISLEELSQILWAAQGITEKRWGFRSVPSAGALYPIEIFVVMQEGVYQYKTRNHSLKLILKEDVRSELSTAALSQDFIRRAPVSVVITAIFERTKRKYGERGKRYVYIEAGHVSQNIYLQCESLNLGTCAVGAFYDDSVQGVLRIPRNYVPLYIMPIGHKRKS